MLATRLCVVALVSATIAIDVPALAGLQYSSVFVFGDSLSDNGNLYALTGIPGAPYWEGRFSNGPVWAERMQDIVAPDGTSFRDFAIGGSQTVDVFGNQVVPFLESTPSAPPDGLYVIWAGANDLLSIFDDGADPGVVIMQAMDNLQASIASLAAAGAQDFVVVNMPDLGVIPRVLVLGDAASAQATALASMFNSALSELAHGLEKGMSISIRIVDSFTLTQQVVENPDSFGLSVVDAPAIDPATGEVASNPDAYLFWDDIHPTRVGHVIIAHVALVDLGLVHPADLDTDGIVGVTDLIALLGAWGVCDACFADIDGSGSVDVHDLTALLENWT